MTGTSPLAWRRNHAGWCAGLALTPGETWRANGDTGEFSEFNRGSGELQELKKPVDWWLTANEIEYMIQVVRLGWFNGQIEDLSKDTTCNYGDVPTNPHLWRSRRKNNQETNIKIIPCVFAQKSLGLVWKSCITPNSNFIEKLWFLTSDSGFYNFGGINIQTLFCYVNLIEVYSRPPKTCQKVITVITTSGLDLTKISLFGGCYGTNPSFFCYPLVNVYANVEFTHHV